MPAGKYKELCGIKGCVWKPTYPEVAVYCYKCTQSGVKVLCYYRLSCSVLQMYAGRISSREAFFHSVVLLAYINCCILNCYAIIPLSIAEIPLDFSIGMRNIKTFEITFL